MAATTMLFLIHITPIGTFEHLKKTPSEGDNLLTKNTVLGPFPMALVHV